MIRQLAALYFLLSLTAGTAGAQLLLPTLLQKFDEKPGLSLTAGGIMQDARGRIWMASTNGIVRFEGRQFRVYHDPVLKEGDFYYQMVPSADGRIWLKMGSGLSLSYIDPRQDRIIRVPDTTRLVRDYLARYGSHYLFIDAQDNLWIGLKGQGLLKVNTRTFAVEHVVDQSLQVRGITQDRRGTIYFTTSNQGFFAHNPQTRKLTNYQHQPSDGNSLSNNATFGVQARPDGSILIGQVNEVSLFWPATRKFRSLGLNIHDPRTTDPRYQSMITEFKLDAQERAYFATTQGLFRYSVQGVLQQIGVRSTTHSIDCIHITPSNRLWVNSNTKLYEYDLNRAPVFSSLLFINLTVNGTPLRDNTNATQQLAYDAKGHPTLTVRENEPVTMQFTLSAKQEPGTLRWRLNDYNHDWISSQSRTGEAAYQLAAGTYTLVVNQGSAAGKWESRVSTLTIVVVAPFWKTPAFLAFVLLLVSSLSYYLIRTYIRRRQLARQLAREQQEATSLRQLDELKTRFFSNVTHEFRTPLTIMLNAAEQLTAKYPVPDELPEVATIQRHAHQLLRLITETLDIARLDAGKLEPHLQLGNPVWFIGQVVGQFAGLATQRGLSLTYNTYPVRQARPTREPADNGFPFDDGLVGFDGEKWEKIAYNLLANALKFTPAGGSVQVTGQIRTNNWFVLSVSDTGIGISRDQQERIFDRFHQVDDGSTRAYSGTGIGLALVRELSIWLGGQVTVRSQPDQGSTFTVKLPLTAPDQAHITTPVVPLLMQQPAQELVNKRPVTPATSTSGTVLKPLVLVVEDNEDLRAQVVNYLAGTYQVLWAENGRSGWEQALAVVPDLIVSDVMMPQLDGYELLVRLKNDERTSHIPVILLTARSSSESRMRGLQIGADDYLTKPFSLPELVLRIGNGLQTRQNWQKRFLAQASPGPATSPAEPVPDREEAFLNRLRQDILDQLEGDALDVDWLASQARMSRTQLNRKLSALTGLSPNRFIQRVRLERAAELLQKGMLNVSEVAYQVGYNSPSHFAKVFQEHFGYPPARLKG